MRALTPLACAVLALVTLGGGDGGVANACAQGKRDKKEERAEKEIKLGEIDPEFQARVNAAVGRGVAWLCSQQVADGTWPSKHNNFTHGPFLHGPTALALLALLKCKYNRFAPEIEKGFAFLEESWKNFQAGGAVFDTPGGWRTYEVGITLMALEALARWEPGGGKKHKKTRAVGGALKRNERAWVGQLRDFLVKYQVPTRQVQKSGGKQGGIQIEEKIECWHYPTSLKRSTDHSNTQYAVLGLRSAHNLGYPAPTQTWIAVFENFMFTQDETGPKVHRVLLDPRRAKDGYVRYKTISSITDRARGWGYNGAKPSHKATGPWATSGSMTTVGIACVEIAYDALTKLSRRDRDARKFVVKRRSDKARSVNDGFAWLAKNFSVTKNPVRDGWHFYYLYGLERAGILSNRKNVGEHDWYREGGDVILGKERGGRWDSLKGDGPIGSTCFALLFLTRATLPLVQTTR